MTRDPVARFIGLRYLLSRREEGFFSLVSVFSFAAMALGVAALIVVLSVMNGFDREIKRRILDLVPHVAAAYPPGAAPEEIDREHLAAIPGVRRVDPWVEGSAMLAANGVRRGVALQGIDPAGAWGQTLARHLVAGRPEELRPGRYGVVLGAVLARRLGVEPGEAVLVSLPRLLRTPAGVLPRVKRLRVVGIFEVGAQVDAQVALLHGEDARRLLGDAGAVGWRLELADPFRPEAVTAAVRAATAGRLAVVGWQEQLASLFAAIRMEKTVVALLLGIVIAVAGFAIVASLVLLVADKRRDIAVLRAMGATPATVARIFRTQGLAAGGTGVALGVTLGSLVALEVGRLLALIEEVLGWRLFDPEVYFITELPSEIRLGDLLAVAGAGLLVSLFATLYPARRAAAVSPAEALRHDR